MELLALKAKREKAKGLREEKKHNGGEPKFKDRKERKEFVINEELKRFEKEQEDELRIEKAAREAENNETDMKWGMGYSLRGNSGAAARLQNQELDLTGSFISFERFLIITIQADGPLL